MILGHDLHPDPIFKVAAALVGAQQRLKAIADMHALDAIGRCVTCDHIWPCRSNLIATGGDE